MSGATGKADPLGKRPRCKLCPPGRGPPVFWPFPSTYVTHDCERGGGTPQGLKHNSCEKLPPVVTRGVLLDIAGLKGVSVLPDDYAITSADLEAAARKQGLRVDAGDVVLLHTGWMQYFSSDPKRWISREPGLVLESARWLAQRRPAAVGADTWGVDLWPTRDGSAFAPHQELITKNGILYLENVVTRELVRDRVYEFAFVMSFLKVKGAGQTWGTFVAIR